MKVCFLVFLFNIFAGAIDLTALDDPVRVESVRTQIENFGQTPPQLLLTPHPQRNPPVFKPSPLVLVRKKL